MPTLARRMLAAWLCGASLSAHALLVTHDSHFGASTLIEDTDTGLHWLRVDVTRGLSYDQIYLGLEDAYSGFRFASGSEVSALVHNSFQADWWGVAPSNPPPSEERLAASREALLMFGAVGDSTLSLSGYSDWGTDSAYVDGIGFTGGLLVQPMTVSWSPTRISFVDDQSGMYKPTAYGHVGAFLVSTAPPIPEPSTYALLFIGLAATAARMRRRRGA